MTLAEAILDIEYSTTIGIWARLVDGKFCPGSPARIGDRQFENGGMLDGMNFFCTGEEPTDFIHDWHDSVIDLASLTVTDEAIIKLIESKNDNDME